MPAPIVTGLITFISQQLGVTVWDGEVPRYDTDGNPVNPDAVNTVPIDWPVVRVYMDQGGFLRTETTEDPYSDDGPITVEMWATSRQQLEDPVTGIINRVEALLAQASNWQLIPLGGPQGNPFYVYSIIFQRWYSGQEEGTRTSEGQLLYKGEIHYQIGVHGAVYSR